MNHIGSWISTRKDRSLGKYKNQKICVTRYTKMICCTVKPLCNRTVMNGKDNWISIRQSINQSVSRSNLNNRYIHSRVITKLDFYYAVQAKVCACTYFHLFACTNISIHYTSSSSLTGIWFRVFLFIRKPTMPWVINCCENALNSNSV